ncbi:MAG: hypothetical protein EPN88_10725 [Bacteroidetes bacterium]|nr:MAG: hypothetical protein EPN88_10725 [Bacteroidota bacterium]
MWTSLKSDLKSIARTPIFIITILAPLILVLLLKLAFPLIYDLIISGKRLDTDDYFTLASITVISSIPLVVGILLVYFFATRKSIPDTEAIQQKELKRTLIVRMTEAAILSLILIILTIVITDPVPREGWLRTLYISFLLALQSTQILLLITNRVNNKAKVTFIYIICSLFLIAVPVGLLLIRPWNCFAFFSPLYWIGWAWITPVKAESIISGSISMIITIGPVLVIYRQLLKKR